MDNAEKQTQDFLGQCVLDERISQEEYDSLRLGRESSGCVRPNWKKWLGPYSGLDDKDCEMYINYPAWTLAEIATHESTTISAVRASLTRVQKILGCGIDPAARRGLPNLSHMIPLDGLNVRELSTTEGQRF